MAVRLPARLAFLTATLAVLAFLAAAATAPAVATGADSGARVAAVSSGAMATASAEPSDAEVTREAYVQELEPICAADAMRNARILQGVRQQMNRGRFAVASRQFARATRAFTDTLRRVIAVPRPEADDAALRRWFERLLRQRTFLAQTSRALAREERLRVQWLSLALVRNAFHANNAVRDFGFDHCLIRPADYL